MRGQLYIRLDPKAYHEHCYTNYELYKPVKSILELVSTFEDQKEINMLDLD